MTSRAGRAPGAKPRSSPVALVADVALPLVIYYTARLVGLGPWSALVLGAALALTRLGWVAIAKRRVEQSSAFVLILIVVGTLAGMVGDDPRLMMARGSWVTAVVGGWLLCSTWARKPALFTVTLTFMSPAAALDWERSWDHEPAFRRLLRSMTAVFGVAFLVDAGARVVMSYTLPLDVVPVLSSLVLVAMLATIVLCGRALARRTFHQAAEPPTR